MADDKRNDLLNEEEESGSGQGNKNALAYGLLQKAGVNTDGMSPRTAWDMVNQMHLMDRMQKRKTAEEQESYDKGNQEAKNKGITLDTAVKKAKEFSNSVALHSANIKATFDAVSSIKSIVDEYNLGKLDKVQTKKHCGRGIISALACANGGRVTISRDLLNNPGACYRSSVVDFAKNNKERVAELQKTLEVMKPGTSLHAKVEKLLENAKEKTQYERHNVLYKGKEVESVMAHELGHTIADQYFGQINEEKYLKSDISSSDARLYREKILNAYKNALENGEIKKVSAYAASDDAEFFAECFCMHQMGEEKLPEGINNALKEVFTWIDHHKKAKETGKN